MVLCSSSRAYLVLGSITSRCSGNEPTLTPRKDGWTRGFAIVDFHQSGGRLLKSSRHKLFFPEQIFTMAESKVLFDMACDRVLKRFKLENLKDLQRKALEKLVNGEDVFVIQPTGSGKSLIYQSSPMAIEIVKQTTFKSDCGCNFTPDFANARSSEIP